MQKPRLGKMKKSTVLLILILAVMALLSVGIVWGEPLVQLFSSQDKIQNLVKDAGPAGPLVLIALQVLQVVVAPIPGQIVSFAAGYLFGTALGTVYTMIGITIGFSLVIVLARRLGRPFVEYFVDHKTLQKFDYIAESKGVFIFFLMALLPFFPDDIICFIAGLTKIRIRTLILVTFVGRLPSNLIFAFAGNGVAGANANLVMIVVGTAVAVSALIWWKREAVERWAKGLSRPGRQ